uniref:Protein kinase domain-containing protein n=1 Tax=Ciona intestinalis TaxID=7719 RepID=H2XJS9_CIOIN
MIDMYSNYPINEMQDVWALGCILYLLCFYKHPFEDSARLAILNANFTIPSSDKKYKMMHPLIKSILQINPNNRPPAVVIVEQLSEYAASMSIDPKSSIDLCKGSNAIIQPQAAPKPVSTPANPPPQQAENVELGGDYCGQQLDVFKKEVILWRC